jgi:hypothetical protein
VLSNYPIINNQHETPCLYISKYVCDYHDDNGRKPNRDVSHASVSVCTRLIIETSNSSLCLVISIVVETTHLMYSAQGGRERRRRGGSGVTGVGGGCDDDIQEETSVDPAAP